MNPAGVSFLLACVAVVMQTRAALHGPPALRATHAAVAVLALVYTVGYAALMARADIGIVDGDAHGEWSRRMLYVGYATWPVVWILPAWRTIRMERRQVAEANKALDDAREE